MPASRRPRRPAPAPGRGGLTPRERPRRRLRPRHPGRGKQARDGAPQVAPGDDHVDHPVLQLELGLPTLGGSFSRTVCSTTRRPAKPCRPRLGDDAVSQGGEAGRDPGRGGVGHDRDVGDPGPPQGLHGGHRLGHLHQGDDPLVLPGPPGGGADDEGPALAQGQLAGAGDLLPHHGAHGGPEEGEVHDRQRHRVPVQAPPAVDRRLAQPRLLGLALQLVLVGLDALGGEVQRVSGAHRPVQLFEAVRVQQEGHPLVGPQSGVVATLGADLEGVFPLPGVDHLPAVGTANPDILRDVLVAVLTAGRPGHGAPKEPSHERARL